MSDRSSGGAGARSILQIGAMLVLTYFVSYSLMSAVGLSGHLEWYPLVDSVVSYVDNGFSLHVVTNIVLGLAETTLGMFVVISFKTLIPGGSSSGGLLAPVWLVLQYVILFNLAMAFVHYVVFTSWMAQGIRLFLAILVLVPSIMNGILRIKLGARLSAQATQSITSAFIDFITSSQVTKMLFTAFTVMLVVLFVIIIIQLTIGVSQFFGNTTSTMSIFMAGLIMLYGMSLMFRSMRN